MKVLVFDTETTGLPLSYNAALTDSAKWPHIVQLSFLLYDTEEKLVLDYSDYIIQIPPEVVISPESIAIHQITPERCKYEGIPLPQALNAFEKNLADADLIVGHNLLFDKRMLMVELLRHNMKNFLYKDGSRFPEYCTMKSTTELCALPAYNNKTGYKYPKLTELHEHLFHSTPKGVHNAMVDVLVCLRCYVFHVHKYDIATDPSVQETLRGLYASYCQCL
jgi:DNA polymerase-3 subunit epsilon